MGCSDARRRGCLAAHDDVRRGRERIWEIDAEGLDDARLWLEKISKRWDEALGRLKKLVEE